MLSATTTTKRVAPKKKSATPPSCSPEEQQSSLPDSLASLARTVREASSKSGRAKPKATLFEVPKPAGETRIDRALQEVKHFEDLAIMAIHTLGYLIEQSRDMNALLVEGNERQKPGEHLSKTLTNVVISSRGGQ